MSEFDVIGEAAITSGRATDAYFDRTVEALANADRDPHVVAEVSANQFPTGEFRCLAGMKDVGHLLKGLPIDADAMREGQLCDHGPVLRISGPYSAFARYETSVLGFLSGASGFATRALDARRAAPETTMLSFGARHVHPSIAAVVERSALIAGFDGFSHVAAGEVLDREPGGTMPHALVLAFGRGEQEAAWAAFDAAAPAETPRIALCDTFSDEVDESVRAADLLGDALDGVRLDTTGSRRGDYRAIVREVRWELDARGYEDVGIFCSGGMDPSTMRRLRDVATGFGVGSYVTDADPVDFALDIVVVDGEPIAKRGKRSGRKEPYRTPEGEHVVRPAAEPAPDGADPLLDPLIRDGSLVRSFSIADAAERARADAETVTTPETAD